MLGNGFCFCETRKNYFWCVFLRDFMNKFWKTSCFGPQNVVGLINFIDLWTHRMLARTLHWENF